jgi:hypothetical protein
MVMIKALPHHIHGRRISGRATTRTMLKMETKPSKEFMAYLLWASRGKNNALEAGNETSSSVQHVLLRGRSYVQCRIRFLMVPCWFPLPCVFLFVDFTGYVEEKFSYLVRIISYARW